MALPKISAFLGMKFFLLAALSGGADAQSLALSAAQDLDSKPTILSFAWPDNRDDMLEMDPRNTPAALNAFLPAGPRLGQAEPIRGHLTVPETPLNTQWLGSVTGERVVLPATRIALIAHGDRLVPLAEASATIIDRRGKTLLFGVGRIWREARDGGQSRAVMPVALVDGRTGDVRNGLAAFRFGDRRPISPMVFQFSQETAPNRAANAWGVAQADFTAGPVPGAETRIAAYEARQASAPDYRDWSTLGVDDTPEDFDGPPGAAGAVSVSALIVDRAIYLTGCNTRHGPYPFCRQMRHGIHSLSSSLLGFVAAAHAVHWAGDDVLTDRIRDVVPEFDAHPQWRKVRIRDLLNMTTGLGEVTPKRVTGFVAADSDETARAIRAAATAEEKLAIALTFPSYPWQPGDVFRFRLADGFGLALALDRLVQQKSANGQGLRDALLARLFSAIGIPRGHMRTTVGDQPEDRIPDLSEGFFPTTGEIVRLTLLLRASQNGIRRTLLNHEMVGQALDNDQERGLPTGITHPTGPGRYHMGFWRFPVSMEPGCLKFVAAGRGWGGTVVQFLPQRMVAIRIADGDPADPKTRDTSDLRRVAHKLRPFCGAR